MMPGDKHLQIGSLLFEGLDQIDLTGPFEVRRASRTPRTAYSPKPLILCATSAACGSPPMLHSPKRQSSTCCTYRVGSAWKRSWMDDEEVLSWVKRQADGAMCVFSVCTGALICGAAGLLRGRRATTHWAAFHLLPFFGAIPVNERVVVDGNMVFSAGVTAGIDGALRVAAKLRGEIPRARPALHAIRARAAIQQRHTGYGTAVILESARRAVREITARREVTAHRFADRFGIAVAQM